MLNNCLYIIIPAYNEEANIRNVIHDWYPIVDKIGADSRLLIVDDGSKDHTYSIIQSEIDTHPQLEVVTKANGGHGSSILFGYKKALSASADYIFQTDSDGQTCADEFWDFWDARDSYDIQIGSRCNREDGFSRVVVTKTLKAVVRLFFHVSIEDANTPFRLMSAASLRNIIDLVPKDYFLTNVLLSVIYTKKAASMRFLPITFRPRQGGVNSINIPRIVGIGLQSVKDFIHLNRRIDAVLGKRK